MNMHNPLRAETMAEFEPVRGRFAFLKDRRVLIGLALAAALVIGVALFGGFGAADEAPPAPQAPKVTVIVPGQADVSATVTASGSIAARREMPVGVQGEGGMVTAVLVDAGATVGAGQVLARIDRNVQSAQLAQMQAQANVARADARLAQSELDRAQTLVERGFISKADIDRRTATRDSANARAVSAVAAVREMEARIARLDIRAPAAGLVLTRAVEPGQIVGAGGQPLFRIAQNGQMEMRALVAEQDMPRLKAGLPVAVTPIGDTRSVTGQIWLVEPLIDPQSRQGTVRIVLPSDPAIRAGGFANARITAGRALQPVLPQSSILADEKGAFVYVVGADNKVARRDVKTGEVSDAGIAITAGLAGNERVVLSAGAFLNPGETISPVRLAAK
jgi:RND family efflux transporter MFP subunit